MAPQTLVSMKPEVPAGMLELANGETLPDTGFGRLVYAVIGASELSSPLTIVRKGIEITIPSNAVPQNATSSMHLGPLLFRAADDIEGDLPSFGQLNNEAHFVVNGSATILRYTNPMYDPDWLAFNGYVD